MQAYIIRCCCHCRYLGHKEGDEGTIDDEQIVERRKKDILMSFERPKWPIRPNKRKRICIGSIDLAFCHWLTWNPRFPRKNHQMLPMEKIFPLQTDWFDMSSTKISVLNGLSQKRLWLLSRKGLVFQCFLPS